MPLHPFHFRHPLVAGLVALLAGLLLMLAAAPDLATIDFSIGGGSSAESVRVEPTIPLNPEVTDPPEPVWVTAPMASPVDLLAGRR